jgi:hypothetical protein
MFDCSRIRRARDSAFWLSGLGEIYLPRDESIRFSVPDFRIGKGSRENVTRHTNLSKIVLDARYKKQNNIWTSTQELDVSVPAPTAVKLIESPVLHKTNQM